MPPIEPSHDNPERSIWLRFGRYLDRRFDPLLEWLVRQVLTASEIDRFSDKRIRSFKNTIDCLLANLYHASNIHPHCYVAISLHPRGFVQSRYNKSRIPYKKFKLVVDKFLEMTAPLVLVHWGEQETAATARSTRLRATDRLLKLINGFLDHQGEIEGGLTIGALVQRIDNSPTAFEERTAIQLPILLRETEPDEVIVLKNEIKKRIDYVDTGETNLMRSNLVSWNRFVTEHFHIDILLKDEELRDLHQREDESAAAFEESNSDIQFVDLTQVSLHRVFNNGSFDEGGRFYGGWWQYIPKKYRPLITINNIAVVELDYSAMQPAMLYAMAGLQAPADDAYEIEGIDLSYRKLIKRIFLQLINTLPNQNMRAPLIRERPAGWDWQRLKDALMSKHEPISRFFRSGIGVKLQRIDSDIAEKVMLKMKDRNVLALPIHDSFITYAGQEAVLRTEMSRAYQERMGSEIDMTLQDQVQVLFNDANDDQPLFDSDIIDNILSQPGYEGYKARLKAFEDSRNDEWHQRFGDARP